MLSFLRCLGHVVLLWQQKSNYHVPGLVQGAICDLPLTVKNLPVNVNRAKVQFVHSEARASPASITYRPDSAMDGVCGIRETRAKGWMQRLEGWSVCTANFSIPASFSMGVSHLAARHQHPLKATPALCPGRFLINRLPSLDSLWTWVVVVCDSQLGLW